MKHPSRVAVVRTETGYRYKHHAHTSHDTYPDVITASHAAHAYAYSPDWVYVEVQQGAGVACDG